MPEAANDNEIQVEDEHVCWGCGGYAISDSTCFRCYDDLMWGEYP